MSSNCIAAEWSAESEINSRIKYNDNLFLTTQKEKSISGLSVSPGLKMLVREKHWETFLDTRLSSNRYSDSNVDSNDIFFDLTGKYSTERATVSITGTLDFDTNLNTESSDFGIAARRIKRETSRIGPKFSWMLTERLLISAEYLYADVDYVDAINTGFVSYNTDTLNGSLVYNFTEKDQINLLLQSTAYESKDGSSIYDVYMARVGMRHQLSESLSINYLLGVSQRDATSQISQPFEFFGQPIILTQVIDSSDSGLVLDVGFEEEWQTSSFKINLSRDNVTDSFGGLNEVNELRVLFSQKITGILNYSISARFEEIESVTSSNQFANRESIFVEPIVNYFLDKNLRVNASYRYVRRKLVSLVNDQAPDSNRIFLGISYNFPSISTF